MGVEDAKSNSVLTCIEATVCSEGSVRGREGNTDGEGFTGEWKAQRHLIWQWGKKASVRGRR